MRSVGIFLVTIFLYLFFFLKQVIVEFMIAHHITEHRNCLFEQHQWIAERLFNEPLPSIVRRVIDSFENEVDNVLQSSVWAVAMAYLDYKEGCNALSEQDHQYARTRGGVIGVIINEHMVHSISLREILETLDPGFYLFSMPPCGPPGA